MIDSEQNTNITPQQYSDLHSLKMKNEFLRRRHTDVVNEKRKLIVYTIVMAIYGMIVTAMLVIAK